MDQLKIALEHKFWILAGLAILLPPIGWWAATDKVAKDTVERITKIAAAEKRIPNAADAPNDKWIKGAKQVEEQLASSIVESEERLYEHQQPAMKVPPIVQDALTKSKVKYRGEGGATPEFLAAREFFVFSYLEDWKSALNEIKPFKMSTGEGLVVIPQEQERENPAITRHPEVDLWRQTLGFTGAQMWDVQEDVWFLRSLMQSIARVNQGATELGNARIKRLDEATLRGGSTVDLAARLAGKTASSPAAAQPVRTGMSLGNRAVGGGGGGGAGSFRSTYKAPKPFDPDDIFGDDGSKGDQNADRKSKDAPNTVEVQRWVEAGGSWRKRGFVLKLVMDEREIPTLLAELSVSPFPVEIRHVEHAAHHENTGGRSPTSSQSIANADGAEMTKEQKAQQQRIGESLRMAFNMHYLADVIIAGTMTIYNEPATHSTKPAKTLAAVGPSTTVPDDAAKSGISVGASKAPAPGAKATMGAASPATTTGATKIQPAKAGTPAPAPAKTNPTKPGGNTSVPTSK